MNKKTVRLLLLLAVLFTTQFVNAAQVSIIIDDIGYRQTDEAVLALPTTVTLSVLPHTPLGEKLAAIGHSKGHEIMLHLPMQALNGKALGPGGLTNQMNEKEFKQAVQDAFESIPYARGVNNHMGSLLTQLEAPMSWLMESLKQKESYFIDSMTTRYSKAGEAADKQGIPLLRRQLFLDNDVSPQALEKQFNQLIKLANKEGKVIVIAHPYPETIRFLQANLPRLTDEGINLVNSSRLLPYRIAHKQQNTGDKAHLR